MISTDSFVSHFKNGLECDYAHAVFDRLVDVLQWIQLHQLVKRETALLEKLHQFSTYFAGQIAPATLERALAGWRGRSPPRPLRLSGRNWLSLPANDDGLWIGVFQQSGQTILHPEARLLVTAEGVVGRKLQGRIDPYSASVQPISHRLS